MSNGRPLWAEDLVTELRAGVPHFKTGQIRAWHKRDGDGELAVVRFVDRMGYAWLVCAERRDDAWVAELALRLSANGLTSGWQPPPERFRFTEGMLQAIASAPEPPATGIGLGGG